MTFLIPLTQRGLSTSHVDNVLWTDNDATFVMDNHRLALWCWFQKMKKGQRYNLLHIDAHPDMSESAIPHFNHDLWGMTLDQYRTVLQKDINAPLFRWDNYIEIFLQKYPELVGKTFSATHQLGSSKQLSDEIKAFDLIKFCENVFSGSHYINDLPWIVNLDLDYFFSAAPQKHLMFSEAYLKDLASSIERGLSAKIIDIFTISLSPECCGSWEKAEEVLKYFQPKLSL